MGAKSVWSLLKKHGTFRDFNVQSCYGEEQSYIRFFQWKFRVCTINVTVIGNYVTISSMQMQLLFHNILFYSSLTF